MPDSTLQITIRARDEASRALNDLDSALDGASNSADDASNSLHHVDEAITATDNSAQKASRELDGVETAMSGAASSANRASRAIDTAGTSLGGVTGKAKNAIDRFDALQSAVGALAVGFGVNLAQSLAKTAFEVDSSGKIFAKTVASMGGNVDEVRGKLKGLSEDLKVPLTVLQQNATELLRAGYNINQITDVFKGGAASGLAFGRTVQESIESVTGALVSNQSALLNNIGVSQNLSSAQQKYAKSLGETADKLTQSQIAQANTNLIIGATKQEVESLPDLLAGYGGATSDLAAATYNLKAALGQGLLPAMTAITEVLAKVAQGFAGLNPHLQTFIGFVAVGAPILVGLTALAAAFAALGAPIAIAIGIFAAFGAAVAAVVAFWPEIQKFVGQIADAFSRGFGAVMRVIDSVVDKIKSVIDFFGKAAAVASGLFSGVSKMFGGGTASSGSQQVQTVSVGGAQDVKRSFDDIGKAASDASKKTISAVTSMTGESQDHLDKFSTWVDSTLLGYVSNPFKKILDWGKKVYNDMVGNSYIPDMVTESIDWLKQLGIGTGNIIDGLTAQIDRLGAKSTELQTNLAQLAGDAKNLGGVTIPLAGVDLEHLTPVGVQKQLLEAAQPLIAQAASAVSRIASLRRFGLHPNIATTTAAVQFGTPEQRAALVAGGIGALSNGAMNVQVPTPEGLALLTRLEARVKPLADAFDSLHGAVANLTDRFSIEAQAVNYFGNVLGKINPIAAFLSDLLDSLAAPIEALLSPLAMVASIIAEALEPVFEALFPIIKLFGEALLFAAKIGSAIWNAFAAAVNFLLGWLGIHLNTIDLSRFDKGMAELAALTWEDVKAKTKGVEVQDKLNSSIAESVRNLPDIVKLTAVRFRSSSPMLAATFGAGAVAGGNTYVIQGPIYGFDDFAAKVRQANGQIQARQNLRTSGNVAGNGGRG